MDGNSCWHLLHNLVIMLYYSERPANYKKWSFDEEAMIDVNSEAVLKIKERYNQIHPLVVHRSVERAKSPGDLFDILDSLWTDIKNNTKKLTVDGEEIDVCEAYPIVWHEEQRRWVKTDDLFQSTTFTNKQKEQK